MTLPRRHGVLPGFGFAMAATWTWVGLIVLIPLSVVLLTTLQMSWQDFREAVFSPRAVAAYQLSLGAACAAALFNAACGCLLAWVLVRYRFPGRAVIDALVDFPFALPTAVAGLTLTALYAPNGWFGRHLIPLDVKVAFAPLGIVVALAFVGLPFVVRTVQPVLESLDPSIEEAAAILGASRWQTFWRVIFPRIVPALLTGFALAFGRGLGEYGSIVFISGNMPMRTEIVPLLIVTKLEQYDYAGATALAVVMLLISFVLLLCVNRLQRWSAVRAGIAGP